VIPEKLTEHRSAASWMAVTCAAAALAAVVALRDWELILVAAAAVVLVWRPAVALTVALIVSQELKPGGGLSPELAFGHQLYFTTVGPFPIILLMVAVAALASLAHWWSRAARSQTQLGVGALGVLLGAGALVAAVAYAQGFSATSSVNQYARPYVEASLCLLVGLTAHVQPGGRRAVIRAGAASLAAVAGAGVVLYISGRGATLEGAALIFYDSALAALAGAAVLALALQMTDTRGKWLPIALAASGVILILSFRRNVWVAVALVFLLALAVRQGRARLFTWAALSTLGIWGLLSLVNPSLPAAIADRAVSWVVAVNTGTADASLRGHTEDIRYGLQHALDSPLLGWGPTHAPLPGLFGQSGYIYVHNEYLYSWLRFGLIGALAILLPVVAAAVVAVRRLRVPTRDALDGVAIALLLTAPICAMTAPFFTSTARWPAMLGLAAGLLLYRHDVVVQDTSELDTESTALPGGSDSTSTRSIASGNLMDPVVRHDGPSSNLPRRGQDRQS
jgi:O-antigen ligase